jgi:hypothetical protein
VSSLRATLCWLSTFITLTTTIGRNEEQFVKRLERLGGLFLALAFSDIGRDANNVAHLCAKQASNDRMRCLWINYNPGFLIDTLTSDCKVLDSQRKRESSRSRVSGVHLQNLKI